MELKDKDVVETRNITLPKGEVLEIEMTQGFIDKAREHFELSPGDNLDDDHIRMFVYGAMNTAVRKAEKALKE